MLPLLRSKRRERCSRWRLPISLVSRGSFGASAVLFASAIDTEELYIHNFPRVRGCLTIRN